MKFDYIIVGAGLVGLGAAYQLQQRSPEAKILVLEKESGVAQHQSTRNSGVIHSGIYYKPGSFKAKLCTEGRNSILSFAEEHQVSHSICGKLIVATSPEEIPLLHSIRDRGIANGISVKSIRKEELVEHEPYVTGLEGLWVSATGIIDFKGFAATLKRKFIERGGMIKTSAELKYARRVSGEWIVGGPFGEMQSSFIVNCAGLYCDHIVRLLGGTSPIKIVPFRGEYYLLNDSAKKLCRNLIYPVPNPAFPFLGVHFTRRFDDSVECGPNAVLALGREGYSWKDVNITDVIEMARYSGFRKLIKHHWKMGLGEMYRSLSKHAFVRALQRLVPSVQEDDLIPANAGVRAQAVRPDGRLEEDFYFHRVPGALHVLNAPSPAATSSLAIGRIISEQVLEDT